MKKKSKKRIKYSQNRVVLSDVLPYEIPLIFSNRHFYNFLNNYHVKFISNYAQGNESQFIKWENKNDTFGVLELILKIFFDLNNASLVNQIKLRNKEFRKIPFTYKIAHKVNDFRELTIPHPKNQLELVSFYEEFKEVILHFSKQSPFSIRKPDRIAKFVYSRDGIHSDKKGDEYDILEESSKEYESLKTFFAYEKYSNIYKFYEDYRFHRAEKKYNLLFKFDIAKCFDSIYTHSIVWSIFSKDIIKEDLKKSEKTFPGIFDKFMQNVNYGETNGIIIGPEFSRIFAELILQKIDKLVESELRKNNNLIYRRDYEIYRYIDDYFIFYNNSDTLNSILAAYKLRLKEFKMSISDLKQEHYEKPIITPLSVVKTKIIDLFYNEIKFDIIKNENSSLKNEQNDFLLNEIQTLDDQRENEVKRNKNTIIDFKCDSNKLITKFKIILSESDVKYKDIMNYSLAVIKKKLNKDIKAFEKYYDSLIKEEYEYKNGLCENHNPKYDYKWRIKHEQKFTNYITELLDFIFFIYTVNPRVNFTIKLCNILADIITTYKRKLRFFTGNYKDETTKKEKIYSSFYERFLPLNREIVFKKIADEINLVLEKNKVHDYVQIETLYLFIALRELGNEFILSEKQIVEYFKLEETTDSQIPVEEKKYKFSYTPNYFVIITMIFYLRDIYNLRGFLIVAKNAILKKIKNIDKNNRRKNTELVLLFFDLLVCPYIDNEFKRKLMTMYGVDKQYHERLLHFRNKQRYWFTKWQNFNFAKEIEAKIALEPY